ncbi:hypothetical protein F5888DRAFT_121637 [Russula emetica]|nr:hypothetical protein F5888DRAFT_121637 [Russula emetica]
MQHHKTVVQVILILFIVNFVLAAPAVRETHEARDNVIVRVMAEDVGAVAEKRGNIFGTHPVPLESEWESDDESDDEGYETASDEPSDHSPEEPPPSQKTIMTPAEIKKTKIFAGHVALRCRRLRCCGLVDVAQK